MLMWLLGQRWDWFRSHVFFISWGQHWKGVYLHIFPKRCYRIGIDSHLKNPFTCSQRAIEAAKKEQGDVERDGAVPKIRVPIEIPRREYQLYRVAAAGKAVNDLWSAIYEAEKRIDDINKDGLDEVMTREVQDKMFADMREHFIGPKPNGMTSGLGHSLFLMMEYAHKLKLMIPSRREVQGCTASSATQEQSSSASTAENPSA